MKPEEQEQHEINKTVLKEMAEFYGGWQALRGLIEEIESDEADATHESYLSDYDGGISAGEHQHRAIQAQKLK